MCAAFELSMSPIHWHNDMCGMLLAGHHSSKRVLAASGGPLHWHNDMCDMLLAGHHSSNRVLAASGSPLQHQIKKNHQKTVAMYTNKYLDQKKKKPTPEAGHLVVYRFVLIHGIQQQISGQGEILERVLVHLLHVLGLANGFIRMQSDMCCVCARSGLNTGHIRTDGSTLISPPKLDVMNDVLPFIDGGHAALFACTQTARQFMCELSMIHQTSSTLYCRTRWAKARRVMMLKSSPPRIV